MKLNGNLHLYNPNLYRNVKDKKEAKQQAKEIEVMNKQARQQQDRIEAE